MARTINYAGVELNEFDLSQRAEVGGGRTVFVAGFTDQGPADEVVQLGGLSEFEDIYGLPTTPAERYAYHTVKAVAENSNASILFSRLPYGAGGGEGFDSNTYGVLAYPVAPVNTVLTSNLDPQLSSNAVIPVALSSFSDPAVDTYFIGKPSYFEITESEYIAIKSGQIQWSDVSTTTLTSAGTLSGAGFFVVNKNQSTLNSKFEGYYIGITDNANVNPATDFNSILNVYSRTDSSGSTVSLPTSRLNFALSSTSVGPRGSVSEQMESLASYDIFNNANKDMVNIGIFRLRKDPLGTDPNVLSYSLEDRFTASFDSTRKISDVRGGQPVSVFLENVDDTSPNVEFFVNPNISVANGEWLDINNIPTKAVRVVSHSNLNNTYLNNELGGDENTNRATAVLTSVVALGYDYVDSLFPLSVYSDTTSSVKDLGAIPAKLQRALYKIGNKEAFDVDFLAEAGLGTIWNYAATKYPTGVRKYDDEAYLDIADLKVTQNYGSEATTTRDNYMAIANPFITLAERTRKDCMFVADALKHIFVQGSIKTLAIKSNYFSRDIYWPLRHQFETINSSYVACYANVAKVYDGNADKNVWVPFSGFAIGNMVATPEPWNAPAGFDLGRVIVNDIAFSPNQKEQEQLYNISINPVVFYPRDGFIISGQKTKQSKPSALDRINVRRTFLHLEKFVLNNMKYFIFQNNTFFTRSQVVNVLTPEFSRTKSGTNPGIYDFKIVCSDSNNGASVIDANELRVDIAIKPVKTAEFIIVNFFSTRTDQNFNEVLPG